MGITKIAPGIDIENMTLKDIEKLAIEMALKKFDDNRTKAASYLDISIRTLQRKIQEYGIPVREKINRWG